MVLTRDIRDEIETAVGNAMNKCIKSDSFIKTIVNNVTEAVVKTMETKLIQLESTVEELKTHYSELKSEYETKVKIMEHKLNEAISQKEKVEVTIEKIDQENRKANLRIFSFKEKHKENTTEEIIKFLNSKMSLKLNKEDIELCYRIGKKTDTKTRGIFIKLKSYETKEGIYSRKKLLKGTGVIIREDLTQNKVQILNKCIEKFGLKNVWTGNGKIYYQVNNQVSIIRNITDFKRYFGEESN